MALPTPKLSVVVVESGPGPLRPAFFDALASELEDGTVEVLVVAVGEPDSAMLSRPGTRWVRCERRSTVPRRRAAGLAEARAPLVALTESFCVPAAGWVEAVLRAHGEANAVAIGGPVDRREGHATHWALTLCEYGRFFRRQPAGPVGDLAGINVAYDAERLRRALGGVPDEIVEVAVHGELRRRGETLWREPEAVMLDASDRPFAASIRSQYHHGRLFGGRRARGQALHRRLLQAALTPAVPLVLIARIAGGVLAAGRGPALLRALAPLCALLAAWAVGEAAGLLVGEGESAERWD